MVPRPFRALRFDPARVELALVVGGDGNDPRHVQRLVDDTAQDGDGKDAPARRAKLRLSEWQRAGVLRRDEQPALYLVKRDGEAMGIFCALSTDDSDAGAQPLRHPGVAVAPVVCSFSDDTGRVKRTLETASDREADATWKDGASVVELFVIDEESTTARVATLIGAGAITVEKGAELLSAHAAWWRAQPKPARDDDAPLAGAHALAFLHPAGDAWQSVPLGAVLLPLSGAL